MPYRISSYSYDRARSLGVVIKPSTVKGKKIDVFNRSGDKLASIGALGYGDYPTFKRTHGKAYADMKRKAYKSRHAYNRFKRGTPGYYADQILW
jgi:hypothetical protein